MAVGAGLVGVAVGPGLVGVAVAASFVGVFVGPALVAVAVATVAPVVTTNWGALEPASRAAYARSMRAQALWL